MQDLAEARTEYDAARLAVTSDPARIFPLLPADAQMQSQMDKEAEIEAETEVEEEPTAGRFGWFVARFSWHGFLWALGIVNRLAHGWWYFSFCVLLIVALLFGSSDIVVLLLEIGNCACDDVLSHTTAVR